MQALEPANSEPQRMQLVHEDARTEDEKWKAVLDRDSSFDGDFVFAVRSTGVYCRPSCSSRHASREQVVFFSGPYAAERSGFRACQRCRPRDRASQRSEVLDRVRNYIEANFDKKITLATLSAH